MAACTLVLPLAAASPSATPKARSGVVVVTDRYLVATVDGGEYRVPIDLSAFVSDADGDPLQITVTSQPSSGLGVVNPALGFGGLASTDGWVQYAVARSAFDQRAGDPTFSYSASDGASTALATITLRGFDADGGPPPQVVGHPDQAWTNAGRSVSIDVLANDENAERIHSVSAVSYGQVAVDGNRLVYTPGTNPAPGPSIGFTYRPALSDAVGAATQVTVAIEPITTVVEDTFTLASPVQLAGRPVERPAGLTWGASPQWAVSGGHARPAAACGVTQGASVPLRLQDLAGPSFYLETKVRATLANGVVPSAAVFFGEGSGAEPWNTAGLAAGLRFHASGEASVFVQGPGALPLTNEVLLPPPPAGQTHRTLRLGFERLGSISVWVDGRQTIQRLPWPEGQPNPYYTVTSVGFMASKLCSVADGSALAEVDEFRFLQGEALAPRFALLDPFLAVGDQELLPNDGSTRWSGEPIETPANSVPSVVLRVPFVIRNLGGANLEVRRWAARVYNLGASMTWRFEPTWTTSTQPMVLAPGEARTLLLEAKASVASAPEPGVNWQQAVFEFDTNDDSLSSSLGGSQVARRFSGLFELPLVRGFERGPVMNYPFNHFDPTQFVSLLGERRVIYCEAAIHNASASSELTWEWLRDGAFWSQYETCVEPIGDVPVGAPSGWNAAGPCAQDMDPELQDTARVPPPSYVQRSYLRVSDLEAHTYSCVARRSFTEGVPPVTRQYSAAAVYSIQVLAVFFREQPQHRTISEGQSTTLTARVETDGGSLVYQWLKDGIELPNGATYQGTDSPILRLVNATAEHSGNYQLRVDARLTNGTDVRTTRVISEPGSITVLPRNFEQFLGDTFHPDGPGRTVGASLHGLRTEWGRTRWTAFWPQPVLGAGFLTNPTPTNQTTGADFPFDLTPYGAGETVRLDTEFSSKALSTISVALFSIAPTGARTEVASASVLSSPFVKGDFDLRLNSTLLETRTLTETANLVEARHRVGLEYRRREQLLSFILNGERIGSPIPVGVLDIDSAGLTFAAAAGAPAGAARIWGFWVSPDGSQLAGSRVVAFDGFDANRERAEGGDLATTYPDRGTVAWTTRLPASDLVVREGALVNGRANPGGGLFSASLPLTADLRTQRLTAELDVSLANVRSVSVGLMNAGFGGFGSSGDLFLEVTPGASEVSYFLRARDRATVPNMVHTLATGSVAVKPDRRHQLRIDYNPANGLVQVWIDDQGRAPLNLTQFPGRNFHPTMNAIGFSLVPATPTAKAGDLRLYSFRATAPLRVGTVTPFVGE